jgi:hypothetical protein
MESAVETLREFLESKTKKESPKLTEIKKCAGRAKTKLFQAKRTELRVYYAEECAKSGVFIGRTGDAIPEGQPKGKDRSKITERAMNDAKNKIRREFYDLYLEYYSDELDKAGIERTKRTKHSHSITERIEKLQAEVSRLETLLAKCNCKA